VPAVVLANSIVYVVDDVVAGESKYVKLAWPYLTPLSASERLLAPILLITVEFLTKRKPTPALPVVPGLFARHNEAKIIILLDADDGVILLVTVVVAYVDDVDVTALGPSNVKNCTCKILPPPAGAAHFKPVASALSATILEIGIVQVLA
jgi:hypothetical protein